MTKQINNSQQRVHLICDRNIAHAQGWNQLVPALQRLGTFHQIGFQIPTGRGPASKAARRLFPETERFWVRAARTLQPSALFHFLWGDLVRERYEPCRQFITTLHQPFERWEPGTLEWCRQLGGVHVLTTREAAYLRAKAPGLEVQSIPHGIDVNFWRPSANGLDSPKKRVVFAGRYMRNLPMFFRVMSSVMEIRKDVTVEILVNPDFHFPSDLLPLPPGFRTVGPFSAEEMRGFFQSAWMMFMPYDNVTASNAICEALACGLPFFTTRVGGMEDYAEGGMVLTENNADREAHANVMRCLDDASWRAVLSDQARAFALRELDWNVIAKKFDAFYRRVAQANHDHAPAPERSRALT